MVQMIGMRKEILIIGCAAILSMMTPEAHCQNIPDSAIKEAPAQQPNGSIMEVLDSRPELSLFKTAVVLAHLDTLLSFGSPLTVFAPTNTAFTKLPKDQVSRLFNPQNLPQLQLFVKEHIITQNIPESLLAPLKFKTIAGKFNSITSVPQGYYINGNVKINLPAIKASNGLIYIIDGVL
jgi:uncharacterized surface protein with fasciclin (FAS1) repeats